MCYGLCDYEYDNGEPKPRCKTNRDSYCARMTSASKLAYNLGREPTEQELKDYMDGVYGYDQ